ncbi:MAG: anti-sigma factor domain-containing protein [Heteroscytonema crispum UTEX LB 1556]
MEHLELSEDWETLIAGYVLGDLTPEEVVEVNQYLAAYPELASEVSSLQATLALLPLTLPETSPPQNLRSQILQAAESFNLADVNLNTQTPFEIGRVEEESANSQTLPPQSLRSQILQAAELQTRDILPPSPPPPLPPSRNFWRRQRTWLGVAGSVAAVLVAGLGFENYRLHQELKTAKAELSRHQQELGSMHSQMAADKTNLSRYQKAIALLNQPNNRLLKLKGMSPSSPSSGSLVIAPNSQVALLTLQNLPPLAEGKVYRMWAFVNGQKVDCATFKPDSEGKVMLKMPLDNWESTTSVAVTIEPEAAITQPTGEMVMTGRQSI